MNMWRHYVNMIKIQKNPNDIKPSINNIVIALEEKQP